MADIPTYDHEAIETKWQKRWADQKAFAAGDTPERANKMYVLEMFPYPSGNLHMGHVRNYAIGDLIARFHRLRGKEVLHPMGWDALGLPAENAALKDGKHPAVRTAENITNVKRQMQRLGLSYDWDREIGTHTPEYYRWNQYFFIKMHERGLLYRRDSEVNWCPSCVTVLANEQVVDGRCWRCESIVEKRRMPEWAFKITSYAQRLLDGIPELVAGGWPERVTTMQHNWIGKSAGLECDFAVGDEKLRIFTTRADTIFGATYVVLAPEHPLVAKITTPDRKKDVEAFIAKMKATDRIARTAEGAEKLGVDTGAKAKNPFTNEMIPVYLANFVLAEYGTGAVMSVPAHDQRDFEFAKKFSLPIRIVIGPPNSLPPRDDMKQAFTEDGILIASGEFSGLDSATAREKIAAMAERGGFGQKTTKWHLRDWGISRQRYWGTPIPIIYCEKDGMLLLREQDLPVRIPPVDKLTYGGGAPLAKIPEFVNTTCWKCGGPAKRDVETMDTFVDSTWYFARFLDPKNEKQPFAREKADAWLPVDLYIGGPEHAVLHLLYFRFWTHVMKDMGLVSHGEPATRLLTQGMVVAATYLCEEHRYFEKSQVKFDGDVATCPKCGKPLEVKIEKMGKSKANGVSPDDMVAKFGADTARVFSLFKSPPEQDLIWDDEDIVGSHRFLRSVWTMVQEKRDGIAKTPPLDTAALAESPKAQAAWRRAHATVKHVTEAIGERFHYNVGVSRMMELKNSLQEVPAAELEKPNARAAVRFAIERLVQVMNPYAPHLAAELWELLGNGEIAKAGWPDFDPKALETDTIKYVIQVGGKLRGEVMLSKDAGEADARAAALADEKVKPWIEGKEIAKVIFVKGKLVNIVTKG